MLSAICATIVLEVSLITSISTKESEFRLAAKISSPSFLNTGTDSPVIALSSKYELPFTIFPSRGTFIPRLIPMVSPILNSFDEIFLYPLLVFNNASSGASSSSSLIAFLDLSVVISSNLSAIAYNNRAVAPSWP